MPSPLDPFRLPHDVVPSRYDITITPDLTAATFRGSVRVAANCVAACDDIVLNALELSIERVTVDGAAAEFSLTPSTERLVIHRATAPGSVAIEIEFEGVLNDKLRGFYRSTFVDHNGVERVIAATQMQSTDCRRAFPCWDEPEFKAVFGITLSVEPDLLAISNSPEVSRTRDESGRDLVVFADTMVMSSYLVAIVVGPLVATEARVVGHTPIRLVHVAGKEGLTELGLDSACKSLAWFEAFYGIPYPGEKIDLVALPDFAAGAMENLGCITFRDSMLLSDPATSTQAEQQVVVDVVAHELAHMWFGDLVTMRWWNGIWLNEAFATFMEILACDAYRPEWNRWDAFSAERSIAFEVDSLAATRTVEFEVRSPQDSDGMFDALTYQKGGSLLRMLQHYLGEDRFRHGVQLYLQRHSFGSTETADLWDAIEAATGEPVRKLMDSWIWQAGYPLVSASLMAGADGAESLRITQRRFSFDPESPDQTVFVVPVHVRQLLADGTSATTKVLLETDEIVVPLAPQNVAVVVNAGGSGFFRVAYDDALRARLTVDAIAGMSVIERYCLLDDAWAAVVAGRLSAQSYVALAEGFDGERDSAVWTTLGAGLRMCARLLDRDDRAGLEQVVQRLAGPVLTELGWSPTDGESDLIGKLRGQVITLLGRLGGDLDVRSRAARVFEESLTDPTAHDAEVVAASTSLVAAFGDTAAFDRFVALFRAADNPQETLRYLYALAEFDDPDLVRRACEFAFGNEVRTQNAPFLIGRAIANLDHGGVAWSELRRHWVEANERFPTNTIVRMVDPVKLLIRPSQVADVQGFFGEHGIPQAVNTLRQILERQRVNGALYERESHALASGLATAPAG